MPIGGDFEKGWSDLQLAAAHFEHAIRLPSVYHFVSSCTSMALDFLYE